MRLLSSDMLDSRYKSVNLGADEKAGLTDLGNLDGQRQSYALAPPPETSAPCICSNSVGNSDLMRNSDV